MVKFARPEHGEKTQIIRKDIKTNMEGICVHVTFNGCFPGTVRGRPVDEMGAPIADDKKYKVRRSVKNPQDLDAVINMTVSDVADKIRRAQMQAANAVNSASGKRKGGEVDENTPFAKAFNVLKDNHSYLVEFARWNERTTDSHLTYFYRNVLPLIQYFGQPPYEFFADDDRDSIRDILREQIEGSANSTQDPLVQDCTLNNTLAAAQRIIEALLSIDNNLPRIKLFDGKIRRIQREQRKSLPPEVRLAFFRQLWVDAPLSPLMVIHIALMAVAALRTAEAAAAIPADLRFWEDGLTSITVNYQEKSGKRDPLLKTNASYRQVVIDYWGRILLLRCIHFLKQQGYTWDAERAPVTAKELRREIKKRLIAAGLTETQWQAVQQTELYDPDDDPEGKKIIDTTAYILRRDRSTVWQWICGLTTPEVDELLGHKNDLTKAERPDTKSLSVQRVIAQKLERFVVDSGVSRNPAHHPVELKGADNVTLPAYRELQLTNTSNMPLSVRYAPRTCLPGDSITVTHTPETTVTYKPVYAAHESTTPVEIVGEGG